MASYHLQAIKIETDVFNSDLKMTGFIFGNILLNVKFSKSKQYESTYEQIYFEPKSKILESLFDTLAFLKIISESENISESSNKLCLFSCSVQELSMRKSCTEQNFSSVLLFSTILF